MILESWPPISMTVSRQNNRHGRDCVRCDLVLYHIGAYYDAGQLSAACSAGSDHLRSWCASLSARMPSLTVSIGLPRVLKYEELTKDPDSSSNTRLVLTDPTSTPM